MVRAIWNDTVIAESDDVEMVDGYAYFPEGAVDTRYLRPSDRQSVCPWKGVARYYDIVVDGDENRAAAWQYREPTPRAAPRVGGRIAFWKLKIERDGGSGRGGLFGRVLGRQG